MTPPSFLILGTDAVVRAAPATPVQLAHACAALGFDAVVPQSWGDELIARRIVDAVDRMRLPLVPCSCPLVAARLAPHSNILGSMLCRTIAPPVATALYVRALYAPAALRLTYAGACPSGAHDAIDEWLQPDELFAAIGARGVRIEQQPTDFDAVLPPDRRRFCSEAGGIPSASVLAGVPRAAVVQLSSRDLIIELAQHLLSSDPVVIDVTAAMGCACAGAADGVSASEMRSRVRASEPPRSPTPVIDHSVNVDISIAPSVAHETTVTRPASPILPTPSPTATPQNDPSPAPDDETAAVATLDTARRRSPTSPARAVLGGIPQSRASGRQLPRAYVARRRSSPKATRQSAIRRQEANGDTWLTRSRLLALVAGAAGVGLVAWAWAALF